MGREPAVASAVLVEGLSGVVRLAAVELHSNPDVFPPGIHLLAGKPHVELRLGKGVVLA
jgi:hypothetical protein